MKESLAWWTREFIEGLRAEVQLPKDWTVGRTILVFAKATRTDRPSAGDEFYFEIPAGIGIESLKTETHLFLFETLPSDPWTALQCAADADASFNCKTLGADNKQGNREVAVDWWIDGSTTPLLKKAPKRLLRPTTASGMQQVRAEVASAGVSDFEYLFDHQKKEWAPKYADDTFPDRLVLLPALKDDPDDRNPSEGWRLVTGLVPKQSVAKEPDAAALELAKPESGAFILVSLRRRPKVQIPPDEEKD
jgi:hypothetical protein